MIVTGVEYITKTRAKVYVDEQFAFVLYKGELSRYHISEDCVIEESECLEIKKNIVLKRAKMRAMHLLEDMDRTESQLKTKLKQGLYTDDVIDEAIAYVKSFGYINDMNYANRFITSKNQSKSRREIYASLCQKGLDGKVIDEAMESFYQEHDEKGAIEAILRKKRYDPNTADDKEKHRIYTYLSRKGFRYDDIRQVIQVYEPYA